MIILKVRGQNAAKMSLVQHNHVIQTLAADRSDQAFDVWILPRRSWRRDDFLDAHVLDAFPEKLAVDSVAITNEKPRCGIIEKRFDDLLSRPFSRRIGCNVEMNNHPPIMAKNDKREKHAERVISSSELAYICREVGRGESCDSNVRFTLNELNAFIAGEACGFPAVPTVYSKRPSIKGPTD